MSKPRHVVCVVDDDDSFRMAMCRLMRSGGMEAAGYACVDDFLQALPSREPDCIIADVRMAGLDGLQIPVRLKEQGRSIPVIFVTAQDTEKTREEAKQVGAAAYFRKPVDDQALLDSIEWATSNIN